MTEDIKGLTRSVTRRRIGYTMAKRNRTNVQTTIYKTLHRTLKIEQLKARGEQTFYSGTMFSLVCLLNEAFGQVPFCLEH